MRTFELLAILTENTVIPSALTPFYSPKIIIEIAARITRGTKIFIMSITGYLNIGI